jgi:hypothetical protein
MINECKDIDITKCPKSDVLISPNEQFYGIIRADGCFVIYSKEAKKEEFNTCDEGQKINTGCSPRKLVIGSTGIASVQDCKGNDLWQTTTVEHAIGPFNFKINNAGIAIVKDGFGKKIWPLNRNNLKSDRHTKKAVADNPNGPATTIPNNNNGGQTVIPNTGYTTTPNIGVQSGGSAGSQGTTINGGAQQKTTLNGNNGVQINGNNNGGQTNGNNNGVQTNGNNNRPQTGLSKCGSGRCPNGVRPNGNNNPPQTGLSKCGSGRCPNGNNNNGNSRIIPQRTVSQNNNNSNNNRRKKHCGFWCKMKRGFKKFGQKIGGAAKKVGRGIKRVFTRNRRGRSH